VRGVAAKATTDERALLAAARGGDESAFAKLIEARRGELHAHCYRMLGSVHDAEDALQETMLRAWRAIGRFQERGSFRSWLYTIATNTCLNAIEKRPKRVLPVDYGPAHDPGDPLADPLAESTWIEPYPDDALGVEDGLTAPEAKIEQREGVELAFVAALQMLPANQRAALILREVMGFSAAETAEALETTTAAVNSALQRARKQLDDRLPERSQQATLRSLGDERVREIASDYATALEQGDTDAVLALVSDDITWAMPPTPTWYRGREEIRRFIEAGPNTVRWRHRFTRANGQLAVAGYIWDEEREVYDGFVIDVVTLREDGLIGSVDAFIDSAWMRRFGLPEELPADTPPTD
jgi:RNA polymerase sigma-70 factor (ECF subfamily)